MNPNISTRIHHYLALTYLRMGRLADVFVESEKQIQKTTNDSLLGFSFTNQSAAHFLAGDLPAAYAAIEHAMRSWPSGFYPRLFSVVLAMARGADGEAQVIAAHLRSREPTVVLNTHLATLSRLLRADEVKSAEAQASFARVWAEIEGEA